MTEQLYTDPAHIPEGFGVGRKIEQVLVIMPGYAADDASRRIGECHPFYRVLGFLWRFLTTETYRGFVRGHRDFYANPRTGGYMAARLAELTANAFPEASIRVIAVDPPLLPEPLGKRQNVDLTSVPTFDDLNAAIAETVGEESIDLAIILHHDALGLGLAGVEKQLLRLAPDKTYAMNGRRRVYRLSRRMRRRLALRRWLAETRIVELCLGHGIGLAARMGNKAMST